MNIRHNYGASIRSTTDPSCATAHSVLKPAGVLGRWRAEGTQEGPGGNPKTKTPSSRPSFSDTSRDTHTWGPCSAAAVDIAVREPTAVPPERSPHSNFNRKKGKTESPAGVTTCTCTCRTSDAV